MDETNRVELERIEYLRDRVEELNHVWSFHDWLTIMEMLQEVAYGSYYDQMDPDTKGDSMMMNLNAAHDEISEMGGEMGWKPWVSPRGWVNRDAAIMEVVDALHFIGNLLKHCNATGAELTAAFRKKVLKNLQRQIEGYDGVTDKCGHCKRDLSEIKGEAKLWIHEIVTLDGRPYRGSGPPWPEGLVITKFCNQQHAELYGS